MIPKLPFDSVEVPGMEGQSPAVYRRLGKIEQSFADAIDSPRNMKPIQAMLASFSKPALPYHLAESIFPIGEKSDLGIWAPLSCFLNKCTDGISRGDLS